MEILSMDAMVVPMLMCNQWKIHSKFTHAINLTNGKDLISITTNNRYLSPGGIRVNVENFDFLDMKFFDDVCVNHQKLILNNAEFLNISPQIYSSYLKPNTCELNWIDVVSHKNALRDWLIHQSKHSASVDWIKNSVSTDLVDAWVHQKLITFEESVNQNHISICSILGAGHGLTPTGDDVLCGYLAIYHYLNQDSMIKSVKQQLLEISPHATTDISINMIFYAVNGYFSDVYRDLIKALFHGGELEDAAENCVSVGHTSGIDFMCGVLKALENISNKKGEDYGKTNTHL